MSVLKIKNGNTWESISVIKGDKGDTGEVTLEEFYKAFPTDTASGAVASFTDGADDLPLKSLVVNIDPVQDTSSGDPSPENICPISGWTEVQTQRTGVNIFDKDATWTSAGNYILNDNGVHVSDSNSSYFLEKINVKPSTSFYIYGGTSVNGIQRLYYFDKDGSFLGRSLGLGAARVETVPSNCHYLGFQYQKSTLDLSKWSISYPSTDHDYHPYIGRTITIDLGQTVYGAKLYPLEGKAVIDRAMVDLGTLNWYKTSPDGLIAYNTDISVLPSALYSNPNIKTDILCEKYETRGYNTITSGSRIGVAMFGSGDARYIRIFNPEYVNKTSAEAKADLSGVKLIYTLLNPIEIQLTPHEVNSLLGQNNIFADTGDSEVEYRADPDLYIQRKMPEVPVDDVQINGTSIVQDGVANVPVASSIEVGVVRTLSDRGTQMFNNALVISPASLSNIKAHSSSFKPITPSSQHASTFYGLAQSAGDTTQSASSNAVGNYTEDAKSAISEMLNGAVQVSGTDPTIVAKSGIRYVCGEVLSLDFTPSATGICDVVFTSGSTTTVLTVPSTIKWANGFDPTSLDANTTYEINVMDGLGVAVGWT